MAGSTHTDHLADWLLPAGAGCSALQRYWAVLLVPVRCTLQVHALAAARPAGQVLVARRGHVSSTSPGASPAGSARYWVLAPARYSCCRSMVSLRLSRQERPAHLLAGSLDPYSHSCASHSPELISLRHLHHHEGQRDSQNSHQRCWLSASAAPVALRSNRRLRLDNTIQTPPEPFVSYMYVSPAACALPFVLVGTWRHVPCSNCA